MTGAPFRLYNEDCLKGLKQRLGDGEVDVVITSPPYNLGVRYSRYKDDRPAEQYLGWIESVAREVKRVLSAQGSFFLNVGATPQNPWTAWDVAERLRPHFVLQNQILWVKSIAVPEKRGVRSVGHYKPVNSGRYLNHGYEFLFHFTKSGAVPLDRLAIGVPYQDKSNIGRWKATGALSAGLRGQAAARRAEYPADVRCRGNVWFVPYKTIQSRTAERPHPATFPVELAEMCLKLHGVRRIRAVLDPFLGIGSTALACRKLGLPFTGFEIDGGYLKEAQKRLEKAA